MYIIQDVFFFFLLTKAATWISHAHVVSAMIVYFFNFFEKTSGQRRQSISTAMDALFAITRGSRMSCIFIYL